MNPTQAVTDTSLSVSALFAYFWDITIKLLFVLVFVILVLFLAKNSITYFQEKIRENNAYEENAVSFSNIAGDVFFYLVLIVSAALGLHVAGFTSTYLILWATFATWYAFKELFQNLLSWILIMTTKEFALGQLLEVYIDDVVHFWRIDLITIRYTVLRKLDMTRVVIPNRLLTRIPVMTFAAEENVRLQTTFTFQDTGDIRWVLSDFRDEIMKLESITEKEFTLLTVDAFHGKSVTVTAYFYFDPKAGKLRFRVISEVHLALVAYCTTHDIVFSYPHEIKTVDVHDPVFPRMVAAYTQAIAVW